MKERGLWIHGWIVRLLKITMPTKRVEDWKLMRECTPLSSGYTRSSKGKRLSGRGEPRMRRKDVVQEKLK
jgi:hypothetical protein